MKIEKYINNKKYTKSFEKDIQSQFKFLQHIKLFHFVPSQWQVA